MSQRAPIGVDGKFGKNTARAFQTYLIFKNYKIAADGIFGKGSITALQQHIGANVDGAWGPNTTNHLQQFLNQNGNNINIAVDGKKGPATYRALQNFLNEYDQNKENQDEKKVEEKVEEERYSRFKHDTKVYTKTCKEADIQINVKDVAKLITNSIKISAGAPLIGNIAEQIQDAVIHCSWSSTQKNEKIEKHYYEQNVYIYLEIDRKISNKSANIMSFGGKNVEIQVNANYIYVSAENDSAKKYLQDVTRNKVHGAFKKYIKKH